MSSSVPFRLEDALCPLGEATEQLERDLDVHRPLGPTQHLLVALNVLMQETGFTPLKETEDGGTPPAFRYILADAPKPAEGDPVVRVSLRTVSAGPKVLIMGEREERLIALNTTGLNAISFQALSTGAHPAPLPLTPSPLPDTSPRTPTRHLPPASTAD